MSDDDRALWAQVARSITPLDPAAPRRAPGTGAGPDESPRARPAPLTAAPVPSPLPTPAPVPARAPLAPFRLGAAAMPGRAAPAAPPAQDPADRLRAGPVQMDARTHRDLSRGRLRPEARIDLHGMTLAVAKAELTRFILSARASGRRLVLVITGKGKGDHGPLPTRAGALRHEVPHWLHMAPVAAAVMQVVPAHFRHGGAGAYYVYLRRPGRG